MTLRVEEYFRRIYSVVKGIKTVQPRVHTQLYPAGFVIVEYNSEDDTLHFGYSVLHALDQKKYWSKKGVRSWAEDSLASGAKVVSNQVSDSDLHAWMHENIPQCIRPLCRRLVDRLRYRKDLDDYRRATEEALKTTPAPRRPVVDLPA